MVGTFNSDHTLSASDISDRTADIHHQNHESLSLNFSNTFLPSALVILSIFDNLYAPCCKNFDCLPENNICHCNLSATSRRLAIDQVLEIKDPNYS